MHEKLQKNFLKHDFKDLLKYEHIKILVKSKEV